MEAPPETVQTLCRMCDDRCGIDVHLEDGRVVDIPGNKEHPWNRGRLCVKARAAVDMVYHPDRLLPPLKRTRRRLAGDPARAGARRDRRAPAAIIERDGARSISVWKGEAIGFGQQEDLARRFVHAIGSPNYLSNDSMCYVGALLRLQAGRRGLARSSTSRTRAAWSCGARTRRTRTPT